MNNLSKSILILSLFVLIVPIAGHAECSNPIKRTLSRGAKGADVKVMQKFLNDNPVTLIAKTGINSKGKENGVFDNATLQAVKIFQKNNSDLILKPAGLKNPNGVFGANARALVNNALCIDAGGADVAQLDLAAEIKKYDKKMSEVKASLDTMNMDIKKEVNDSTSKSNSMINLLNSLKNKIELLSSNKVINDITAREISKELGVGAGKAVKIRSIMPLSPKPGNKIYVFGDNLLKENTIYIGEKYFIINKSDTNDNFISFEIPSSFTPGSYDIYIKNLNGKSENIKIQISADESVNSSLAPKIISISPTSGNIGTEITVTGIGFTKNNSIYTTTKSFLNILSIDGKTIKFKVSADAGLLTNAGKLISELPFSMFIRNENGDSNIMSFKLE